MNAPLVTPEQELVLGIDPGIQNGGFAVIGKDKTLYLVDLFKSWSQVRILLEPYAPYLVLAAIEEITTRPGEGRGGGCKFCANYGGWVGITTILAWRNVSVNPRKWQSAVGGRDVKYRSKERIAEVCKETWPTSHIWHIRNKAKLHGHTDALGIALYAHRLLFTED